MLFIKDLIYVSSKSKPLSNLFCLYESMNLNHTLIRNNEYLPTILKTIFASCLQIADAKKIYFLAGANISYILAISSFPVIHPTIRVNAIVHSKSYFALTFLYSFIHSFFPCPWLTHLCFRCGIFILKTKVSLFCNSISKAISNFVKESNSLFWI